MGAGGAGMGAGMGSGGAGMGAGGAGMGAGGAGAGPGGAGPGTGSGGVAYSGPQSMDQYSYFGALPAKKSGNYMPVTADFSSFRH